MNILIKESSWHKKCTRKTQRRHTSNPSLEQDCKIQTPAAKTRKNKKQQLADPKQEKEKRNQKNQQLNYLFLMHNSSSETHS
jgi:hypothetical protein